ERIHRMAREVQAKRLALAFATHALAPLGQRWRILQRRRRCAAIVGSEPEEIVLARLDRLRILIPELHRRAEPLHERRAVHLETIETARADERFEHASIELLQVEPPAQAFETRERTVRFALRDERFNRALPHAAHRAETVANGPVVIRRELIARDVHI